MAHHPTQLFRKATITLIHIEIVILMKVIGYIDIGVAIIIDITYIDSQAIPNVTVENTRRKGQVLKDPYSIYFLVSV
jgi:hypothetical protein